MIKRCFRWTWFNESLLYTDTKGNQQTTKVSNVFKKCAKATHVWCDIVNVSFHIPAIFQ